MITKALFGNHLKSIRFNNKKNKFTNIKPIKRYYKRCSNKKTNTIIPLLKGAGEC